MATTGAPTSLAESGRPSRVRQPVKSYGSYVSSETIGKRQPPTEYTGRKREKIDDGAHWQNIRSLDKGPQRALGAAAAVANNAPAPAPTAAPNAAPAAAPAAAVAAAPAVTPSAALGAAAPKPVGTPAAALAPNLDAAPATISANAAAGTAPSGGAEDATVDMGAAAGDSDGALDGEDSTSSSKGAGDVAGDNEDFASQAGSDDSKSSDASGASEASSEPQQLPGEGCVANSLTRVGIYPKGNENAAAKAGLNAQIDAVHAKLCQSDPSVAKEEAGKPDEVWHREAVKRAVIGQGHHFLKLPIDPTHPNQVDLLKEFKTGDSFLVDGLLNCKFKKSKNGKKWGWEKRYDDEPDESNPADWHMVGVQNGKILDHEFALDKTPLTDFPVDCFWLRADSTPHPKDGYFRRVRRVYWVPKCTKASGQCAGCDMLKKRKRGSPSSL